MMLRNRWTLNLALMVAAAAFTAAHAKADDVYKGTFNLPEQTYWGTALLQPGEYHFTVDQNPGRTYIVRLQGEGVEASVLAGAVFGETASDHGFLKIVDMNGVYVVRELNAGNIGKEFEFMVPKAAQARGESASVPAPNSTIKLAVARD
jgi:hypothetical protein